MNRNREGMEGMYCSRRFADWMLKKNRQDLDYPALSYQKLIRLFCRPNYNEFFEEEECKGNQFVYDIIDGGEKITFRSSYELVFLPYEERIGENPEDDGEYEQRRVEEFVPGYRILQTRGCMPGSTEAVLGDDCFYTMKYVVDEMAFRSKRISEFAKEKKIEIDKIIDKWTDEGLRFNPYANIRLDDIYRASEFQEAEMKDFIDNEWPFSAGPECPDKLICRQMYTRIINHLMRQIDRAGLAGCINDKYYELHVAACVAAILSLSREEGFSIEKGIRKDELLKKSKELFEEYCELPDTDLDEACRKIRIGVLWDVNIVIDRNARGYSDYDYKDSKEAPIGLTAEDYGEFDRLSRSSGYADDCPVLEDEDFETFFDEEEDDV